MMKTLFVAFGLFCLFAIESSVYAQTIKVVCLGNSITAGYQVAAGSNYVDNLTRLLGSGYSVVNCGYSGVTLLRQNDSWSCWDRGIVTSTLAANPNIVIIELGTNDSKAQYWPANQNRFVGDYCKLIDTLAKLPSHPSIWLCRPIPGFSTQYDILPTVVHSQIEPRIDSAASIRQKPVIDLYTPLLGHQSDYLQSDGIHPNSKGDSAIAAIVYNAIKTPNMSLRDSLIQISGNSGQPSAQATQLLTNYSINQLGTITIVKKPAWLTVTVDSVNKYTRNLVNTVDLTQIAQIATDTVVLASSSNLTTIRYLVRAKKVAPQVATSIWVSPDSIGVLYGRSFTASAVVLDQYGEPLTTQPVPAYSVSGGGTISQSGVFTAGNTNGTFYVIATSGSLRDSATVTITKGITLPAGYVKTMLLLTDSTGSECIPYTDTADIDLDLLNTEKSSRPRAGDPVVINNQNYAWKAATSTDGMWATRDLNTFFAYGAIYLNCFASRTIAIKYRHDDDFKVIWNDSVIVREGSGWDEGNEKTSVSFTLKKGINKFVFKLREFDGDNEFAVRFVDQSGNNLRDLSYQLDPDTAIGPSTASDNPNRRVKAISFAAPETVAFYTLNGRQINSHLLSGHRWQQDRQGHRTKFRIYVSRP